MQRRRDREQPGARLHISKRHRPGLWGYGGGFYGGFGMGYDNPDNWHPDDRDDLTMTSNLSGDQFGGAGDGGSSGDGGTGDGGV